MSNDRDEARQEIEKLQKEIATDDELLKDRNDFIADIARLIGGCPVHGDSCMPHLKQKIEKLSRAFRPCDVCESETFPCCEFGPTPESIIEHCQKVLKGVE